MDKAKKLRLTKIKKYSRHINQFKIELDQLYNQILILGIFIKYLQKIYNKKKVDQKYEYQVRHKLRIGINFFVQLYISI